MEPKKIKNPTGMLIMHGTVIAVVLYMAWQLVRSYRAGGAEAPSLTTLIVGLVLLMFDAKAGLHNPLRFALLLTNFGSVMTWGVVILAAFVIGAGGRAAACRSCAGESEGSGEFGRITEVLCCA